MEASRSAGQETTLNRARRPAGDDLVHRARPSGEPAVEDRGRVPGHPQHPDESGGVDTADVVVGDHRVVVADAEQAHRLREPSGLGKRVPAGLAGRRPGQAPVEVHEDRPFDVTGVVGGRAGPPVQVPARVGDHDVAQVGGKPPRRNKNREPHIAHPPRSRRRHRSWRQRTWPRKRRTVVEKGHPLARPRRTLPVRNPTATSGTTTTAT